MNEGQETLREGVWEEPAASARRSSSGCDCDEAVAELWAYLDSELEPIEAERVKEHLEGCDGCLGEHDVELVVKKLVKRCWEQDEAAPADLRARIHATLTGVRVTETRVTQTRVTQTAVTQAGVTQTGVSATRITETRIVES